MLSRCLIAAIKDAIAVKKQRRASTEDCYPELVRKT
jgi:hypothetical protein